MNGHARFGRTPPLCIHVHWDSGVQEICYCVNRTNGVSGEICKMHINQGQFEILRNRFVQ